MTRLHWFGVHVRWLMSGSVLSDAFPMAFSLNASVLGRIAAAALNAPDYPQNQIHVAWHADGCDAPIPVLSAPAREAVKHAIQAISMYRASLVNESNAISGNAKRELYNMQYQLCGCHILQYELRLARTELESLAKILRPNPTAPPSPDQTQLNANVLGTLQWITGAMNDVQASKRYATWREKLGGPHTH